MTASSLARTAATAAANAGSHPCIFRTRTPPTTCPVVRTRASVTAAVAARSAPMRRAKADMTATRATSTATPANAATPTSRHMSHTMTAASTGARTTYAPICASFWKRSTSLDARFTTRPVVTEDRASRRRARDLAKMRPTAPARQCMPARHAWKKKVWCSRPPTMAVRHRPRAYKYASAVGEVGAAREGALPMRVSPDDDGVASAVSSAPKNCVCASTKAALAATHTEMRAYRAPYARR
jgi:hypothetical protein